MFWISLAWLPWIKEKYDNYVITVIVLFRYLYMYKLCFKILYYNRYLII